MMLLLLIGGSSSLAKDRLLVSAPSYALGYATDLFIKGIVPKFSQNYRRVRDEENKVRIQGILLSIYQFSGHNFTNDGYVVTIIQGDKNEPNAFTSGKSLYVTHELCNLLNDRELTAVIAHEMAHAERSHLLRRVVYSVGSPFLAVYNYILGNGASTHPQQILAGTSLMTELEADCIAATWLMTMRKNGRWHHAEDLNRATAKLFGGTQFLEYLDITDPPVVRYRAIQNKNYEMFSCSQ